MRISAGIVLGALASYFAQSEVQDCEFGDGLECSKKIIVSVAVEQDSHGNEFIEFKPSNQDNSNEKALLQDAKIRITKSKVSRRYTLTYLGDVPNKMSENVVVTTMGACDESASDTATWNP